MITMLCLSTLLGLGIFVDTTLRLIENYFLIRQHIERKTNI